MKQGGKKSGNFKDGHKAPEFKGGLDWEAIRRCHRPPGASEPLPARLQLSLVELDRANRGVQNYYDGKDTEREKKVKSGRKGEGRHPTFDVDEAVRLYTEEHMTPQEVAEALGLKTAFTIIKRLKDRGVYDANKYRYGSEHSKHKPKNRPKDTYKRQDTCAKGHDLTVEGSAYDVYKTRNGKKIKNGRACVECKKDRDAKYKAEKEAQVARARKAEAQHGITNWARGKHDG